MRLSRLFVLVATLTVSLPGLADETCNSPYMTGLIKGQEDFVHVWTLGNDGQGDGSDKLVTIDANPKSPKYGKVIHQISVGERGEAHHMGFTDDRKYLWAGSLDSNKIFVFDVGTDPAKPKLIKTLGDHGKQTGYLGPHTFYAMPGRMLIGNLSNTKDKGGTTGLTVYNNAGGLVAKYPMPTNAIGGVTGDGYGYDIAINPAKNALLTSSFAGWKNYMRDLGEVVADPEAMKNFGKTMVMWDLKAMRPTQIFEVPGCATGDSLVSARRRQLGSDRDSAHLEDLDDPPERRWRVGREGNRHDRRSRQDPAARRYFNHRRWQRPVGQHVHGWDDPLLRSVQSRPGQADVRQADRQTGQHDLAELGRQARLHHQQLVGEVGQERR